MSCALSTPDADATRCPESRTPGTKVKLITLKALVTKEALRRLDGGDYRFCSEPGCDVVYFDLAAGSAFGRSDLTVRVGQKELEDPIPVCYCFGYTLTDLRAEVLRRGTTRIAETIAAEIGAGHCACEVRNPAGSCCLGDVSTRLKALSAR